jgi:hypothetical protein
MIKYIVDIDNTICNTIDGDYENSTPDMERIKLLNDLYDTGLREMHYWTARGANSGKDWSIFTKKQLDDWGVKYASLRCDKPAYDMWIDDKAINSEDFFLKP